MKIQINTDNNITGSEEMNSFLESTINDSLSRFSDRISRLEVHLSDENSLKEGPEDMRCMLEARIEGLKPISVTNQADTIHEAVAGALVKVKAAIESTLGKLRTY